MKRTLFITLLLWAHICATPTQYTITKKKDIKRVKQVAFLDGAEKGALLLRRDSLLIDSSAQFKYSIALDGADRWSISLPAPNKELDAILKRNKPAPPKKKKPAAVPVQTEWRGHSGAHLPQKITRDFHHTPWNTLSTFWNGKKRADLLQMFQWESGGEVSLGRHHYYNFALDTATKTIDLMKTSIVEYDFNLSYREQILPWLWAGAGIRRSGQHSSYFDSIYTESNSWIQRMGWHLSVAVPGFEYRLSRDPGLIPHYGLHDRKVFRNLTVGNDLQHEFLYKLNIFEGKDTLGIHVENIEVYDSIVAKDTTYLTRGIRVPRGVASEFRFKIGHFRYSLHLDPFRYTGPIQEFFFRDLPFFKGEWEMGLVRLPYGRYIPSGEVDLYTHRFNIFNSYIDVTPARISFQVASRDEFYVGIKTKIAFPSVRTYGGKNREK